MIRNFPLPPLPIRIFTFTLLGRVFPKLFFVYCGLEFINYSWHRYYLSNQHNIKKDDEEQSRRDDFAPNQVNDPKTINQTDLESTLSQEEKTAEITIDINTDLQILEVSEQPKSPPPKKPFVDPLRYFFMPIGNMVTNLKNSLSKKPETLPKPIKDKNLSNFAPLERQTSGDSQSESFVIIDPHKIDEDDVPPLGEYTS